MLKTPLRSDSKEEGVLNYISLDMRIVFFVLITLVIFSGCVIRDEFNRINAKLDDIDASNRRLENSIQRLDTLSIEEIELIMKFRAEQDAKLEQIDGDIESTRNAVNELSGVSASQSKDTTLLTDIYSIAYSDYIQGNYDLAITGFKTYINSIPNLDETLYLLGECYYENIDYINAIGSFEIVIQSFSKSKRVPISLYRIGKIYEIMGDSVSANRYYEVLRKDYPNSEESKLLIGSKK